MPKFLNTSATNYFLEELIKNAAERLIIISPFLKFNDRIKELLADKDRMKIDVRIVYGKSELAPQEINWLRSLEFVRTSFCQNLHAKCYLNEKSAIITSMNLYDFSQVNNNEMGVYIEREQDVDVYRDAYEEAQRLIRVSEQVRLAAEKVEDTESNNNGSKLSTTKEISPKAATNGYEKITTSKLAKQLGLTTSVLTGKLLNIGYLIKDGDKFKITDEGKKAGGEFRFSKKFGPYFLWPIEIQIE